MCSPQNGAEAKWLLRSKTREGAPEGTAIAPAGASNWTRPVAGHMQVLSPAPLIERMRAAGDALKRDHPEPRKGGRVLPRSIQRV